MARQQLSKSTLTIETTWLNIGLVNWEGIQARNNVLMSFHVKQKVGEFKHGGCVQGTKCNPEHETNICRNKQHPLNERKQ